MARVLRTSDAQQLVTWQISEAARPQLQPTRPGASCGTEAYRHADTNTQRSTNRLPYGAGTHVPRHQPDPRLAAPIRELWSSRLWHPTTTPRARNTQSAPFIWPGQPIMDMTTCCWSDIQRTRTTHGSRPF